MDGYSDDYDNYNDYEDDHDDGENGYDNIWNVLGNYLEFSISLPEGGKACKR